MKLNSWSKSNLKNVEELFISSEKRQEILNNLRQIQNGRLRNI